MADRDRGGTLSLAGGVGMAVVLLMLIAASTRAQAGCGWGVVPAGDDDVQALASINAGDTWAVGYQIQHWNGSDWSLVETPPLGSPGSVFLGIDPVSSSDIWIAGHRGYEWRRPRSLIEHWDGSAWTVSESADPSPDGDVLSGIDAISSSDVWAVGYSKDGESSQETLVEHWDGATWSQVPSPNTSRPVNALSDVVAISPVDIWAVGSSTGRKHRQRTLAMHWDGATWSIVVTPNPGDIWDYFTAIDGSASDDIWAVGDKGYGRRAGHVVVPKTMTAHWDGTSWSVVDSPHVRGKIGDYLEDVTYIASNDVWAVGTDEAGSSTLAVHWDGTAWTTVPTQDAGSAGDALSAVSASSGDDVWAAGVRFDRDMGYEGRDPPVSSSTLAEHWGC